MSERRSKTAANKPKASAKRSRKANGLRITDPESARVAMILGEDKEPVGAGCLISGSEVLTCHHVVGLALKKEWPRRGDEVYVRLVGDRAGSVRRASLKATGNTSVDTKDLAILRLMPPMTHDLPAMEFVTPFRLGGKQFLSLGFPNGSSQGRYASGVLQGPNADWLAQMDSLGPQRVQQGFSGSPVWSPECNGFVGIVVTELREQQLAWCIPSQIISEFCPQLLVRYCVPESDRPIIHDLVLDDPNITLYGTTSDNGHRRLEAEVEWDDEEEYYIVTLTYKRLPRSPAPRGGLVTFLTYPGYGDEGEDAYELTARLNSKGVAQCEFYPSTGFTAAAIGDAGTTALTIDLTEFTH